MPTTEEAYPSYRFYVEIAGVPQAVFTEVSGLQIETEITEYEEGGNNDFVHRLPGRTKIGNITLKRGMTSSNELLQWFLKIARGSIDRRNVTVIMYDSAGNCFAGTSSRHTLSNGQVRSSPPHRRKQRWKRSN